MREMGVNFGKGLVLGGIILGGGLLVEPGARLAFGAIAYLGRLVGG